MQLKPNTQAALDSWLSSTWDSGHRADETRFHRFVDQYQRDQGFSFDESALRDEITRRAIANGRIVGTAQKELIHESVSLAHSILRFLKDTDR